MADVFCAKQVGAASFQRLVAIKRLLPHLSQDPEFVTMFVDEAKLAAQLDHARIAQIYELGEVDGQWYIAMEFIRGRDLRHILRRAAQLRKPLPVAFAAYVVQQAAEALDVAHRQQHDDGRPLNLVHRDISPHNVLVSYNGDVKVVDFGIAKATVRDSKTRDGVLKGKAAYMTPEQVRGDEVDRRSDIFALGTLLYELCTGTQLFAAESEVATLEKVRMAARPQLATTRPELPSLLDAVLAKALAPAAADRYAWAGELADALSPFLVNGAQLYGAREAGRLMQEMFADDIQRFRKRRQWYAATTLAETDRNQRPLRVAPPASHEAATVLMSPTPTPVADRPRVLPPRRHTLAASLPNLLVRSLATGTVVLLLASFVVWQRLHANEEPAWGSETTTVELVAPPPTTQALDHTCQSAPSHAYPGDVGHPANQHLVSTTGGNS